MNIFYKIKQAVLNPESLSVANIMSAILIYSLDNYMQIGAALSFFATTIIAIVTKYSKYKQDKLDRIQKREIEMLRTKSDLGLIVPIQSNPQINGDENH